MGLLGCCYVLDLLLYFRIWMNICMIRLGWWDVGFVWDGDVLKGLS